MVFRFENVERERVAAFFERVDDFLELGEHGLPEERAADVINFAIDEVGARLRVVGLFEEMMCEQLFVKGGGDFSEKDRVVVILVALRLLREPGVHRVPGLVRERVNVGEDVALVVHEDVGRRAVAAGGEGAAAFPFRLVTIAPAATQTFRESAGVFVAERGEGGDHLFDGFIKGDARFDFRDQWDVSVVLMQLVEAEDAAPQVVIAEEGREIPAHGADQAVVNGDRDVIAKE